MQQQLEEPSTVDDRITISALEETSDLQNWEQIAALADEFWLRWNTRRGLVPTGTGNCQSKGQYGKETESQRPPNHRFMQQKSINRCSELLFDPMGLTQGLRKGVELLPSHARMIVDDHLLNYPSSDLREVLTGRKPFQEVLQLETEMGPESTTTTGIDQPKNNTQE
jgi:hypothetical protein